MTLELVMLPNQQVPQQLANIDWKHRPSVNRHLATLSDHERLTALSTALNRYEKDTFLLGQYGRACLANNDPMLAIGYLLQAIEPESRDASLVFSLGLAYSKVQQPGKAIPYLQQAADISCNPDHIMVLIRVASESGDYVTALNACKTGLSEIQEDSRFPCAHVNTLVAMGRPEQALDWIAANDRLDCPDLAFIEYRICNSLGKSDRAASAHKEFQRRQLRKQPDYRNRANLVLQTLSDQGSRAALVQHWETALGDLLVDSNNVRPQVTYPSIAMSILVRDEIDIIEQNIRYHAHVGIQHFVVTDNGSVDGTREKLSELQSEFSIQIFDEPSHTIDQDLWVTRMAKAISDTGKFDWIIHNDADEFWVPQQAQSLPEAILKSLQHSDLDADEIGVLQCRRVNMLPCASETQSADYTFCDNVHAVRKNVPLQSGEEKWNDEDVSTVARLVMDKVMTRSDGLSEVEYGNHGATHTLSSASTSDVLIYHYPVRTYAQFERKVVNYGRSLEKNNRFSSGSSLHLRYWYRRYQSGELKQDYNAICLDDAEMKKLVDDGFLEKDTSLRDVFSAF